MRFTKKNNKQAVRPLVRRVRYSVNGINERTDVSWWIPENDFDKSIEMLELAFDLLFVPEHAQDAQWHEEYEKIRIYLGR